MIPLGRPVAQNEGLRMATEVKIIVPDQYVGAFYQEVGKWLSAIERGESRVEESQAQPWRAEDVEEAKYVWEKSSPIARKVLDHLMNVESAGANELVSLFGFADAFELSGVFAWPGRHAFAQGRKAPVRSGRNPEGTIYWLEPDTKEAIKQAKAELGL
jgi:hypothetical protein